MFSRILIIALIVAVASAFGPARFSARSIVQSKTAVKGWEPLADPTEKNEDGRCYKKDVDHKGRCPGDSGYKPPVGNAPSNFAEYAAAMKAKKAAGK